MTRRFWGLLAMYFTLIFLSSVAACRLTRAQDLPMQDVGFEVAQLRAGHQVVRVLMPEPVDPLNVPRIEVWEVDAPDSLRSLNGTSPGVLVGTHEISQWLRHAPQCCVNVRVGELEARRVSVEGCECPARHVPPDMTRAAGLLEWGPLVEIFQTGNVTWHASGFGYEIASPLGLLEIRLLTRMPVGPATGDSFWVASWIEMAAIDSILTAHDPTPSQ